MKFMSVFKRSVLPVLLLLVTLSACGDTKDINTKIDDTDTKVTRALDTFTEGKKDNSPLTVSNRPWFGQQAVSITSGIALPPQFTSSDAVTLTFDQPLTLRQTANLIQSVTGLRVLVNEIGSSSGGASASATSGTATTGFLPVNGREVRGSKMIWQGSLNDLLDQVADAFDAGWSYDGANITINQEVTKTFMLHALATVVSDTSKVESGTGSSAGGGSSGGLPSVTTQGTTELKVWDEVKSVIDSIVTGKGRATYSPSTGTITVSGTPAIIARVENYLRFQNELRLRRIAVSIKVLELTLSNTLTAGLSATQVLERVLNNQDFSIISGSGGLTAGFIAANSTDPTPTTNDDISAVLTASKEIDRISVVHSGAVVTLSDQPAPLQVGRQISYLARRSSTSGAEGSGGTETLEPGTVDVGLILNVLPRVIEDNRVMLRLNVALTDTETPFPTFPDEDGGSESIQLPEVATTGFQQNTVLRNGETLVLAGFERNENSLNDDGIPGIDSFFGGQKSRTQSREVTVLLITANILPEDPISVYAENR